MSSIAVKEASWKKCHIHFAAYTSIHILAALPFPVFDMYGSSYMSVTQLSLCLTNAPQRRHTSKLSQIQTNEGEVAAVLGGNLNWKCAYTCSVLGPVYFRKPLQLVVVSYKGAGQPATNSQQHSVVQFSWVKQKGAGSTRKIWLRSWQTWQLWMSGQCLGSHAAPAGCWMLRV